MGDYAWFRLNKQRNKNVYSLGDDYEWNEFKDTRDNCSRLTRWTMERGRFMQDSVFRIYFQPIDLEKRRQDPDYLFRTVQKWFNRTWNRFEDNRFEGRLTVAPLICSHSS